MASKGRAKLAVDPGVSVWLLEAPGGFGDASVHAHHAIQLTVCFEGQLTLGGDHGSISAEVVAVAPDTKHQLQAHGLISVIFVEPESPTGRSLGHKLFSESPLIAVEDRRFRREVDRLRQAIDVPLSRDQMLESARAAIHVLAPNPPEQAHDRRIDQVLDYIASHTEQQFSLDTAARAAGIYLSSSRLRHLLVEQTGLAFNTYMLWVRLVKGVQMYSEGLSLTEAAHAAGFADSAHFSRAFKRTFGASATTLSRL